MIEIGLVTLLAALAIDWFVGDPKWLWQRLPHPIALFGRLIQLCDQRLNRSELSDTKRYRYGAAATVLFIFGAGAIGWLLSQLFLQFGFLGIIPETLIVAIFLAQKSLKDHVSEVASGLDQGGVEAGRKAVAALVGRDPQSLDRSDIIRAAIESLAENFSDGVVAPAFWYMVFGLPGIVAYKMINTADSMIGYRTPRHLHFGRVAAQIDDMANFVPARLAAILLVLAAGIVPGSAAMRRAFGAAMADAGLHASPNSGWPEAAMAGALDIALGGPRRYSHDAEMMTASQAHLNGAGRIALETGDIYAAIKLFTIACFMLAIMIVLLALLF